MELLAEILFRITLLIGIMDILLACILFFIGLLRHEVKKGNKDQQEIKTRLAWLKKGINSIQKKFNIKG